MTQPKTSLSLFFLLLALAVSAASGATYYVSQDSTPQPPYDAWTNAAHLIHEAVAQATSGDTVLVSNGIYRGYSMVLGGASNVVVVTNGVRLMSLNGVPETRIDGGSSNRPVYVEGSNSLVSGFWIENGVAEEGGGGYCANYAVISNCFAMSNSAELGGGFYLTGGGVLDGVQVYTNRSEANGGGIYCTTGTNGLGGQIRNSDVLQNSGCRSWGSGGGIYGRDLQMENTTVSENQAVQISADGGGVYLYGSNSWMRTCMVDGNDTGRAGGGIYARNNPLVENCTVILNSARESHGGGVACNSGGRFRNSIIYYNTCDRFSTSNLYSFNTPEPVYDNCCIPMTTNGTGQIHAVPQYEDVFDHGYNLLATSPCMDVGTNQPWMADATDLSGYPRIYNHIVDIGVDENAILATRTETFSGFACTWTAPREGVFRLQWSTNPVLGNSWQDWGNAKTSTGTTITFAETNLAPRAQFYRLIWDKQP